MNIVVRDGLVEGLPALAASGFPVRGVAGGAVEGDLIVTDDRSVAPRSEAQLTLVVDVVPADDRVVGETQSDTVVEPYLVVNDPQPEPDRCGAT